jgi:polysaccharide deacetylase 2 family uncharacterized protein YibQ
MTRKKRKGGNKRRKSPKIQTLILFPAFLVCALLLSLYVLFSKSTIGLPEPIYEEVYSSANYLNEAIKNVDYAIYESLYQSGIKERNIIFLDVQPRHENGHFWDFTRLLIRCPDIHSAQNLERCISYDLIRSGARIRLRWEKTPEGKISCHVFAEGFYTHRLDLEFHSQSPKIEDTRPKLAVIIDDFGYDPGIVSLFAQLDLPLSFSVLPSAPFTGQIVRQANKEKCELILHLPMEPKNHPRVNPGPGALFLSMEERKIRQVLDQDLREVWGAIGVNNHMGSSFTENPAKMAIVLRELKKRRLFFVDSRTSADSVGFKLAKKMGLPTASRSVFLDNDLSNKAIKMQFKRLLSIARNTGAAIGIGHPRKETLKILEEYWPKIKTEFQVVPVSELVG